MPDLRVQPDGQRYTGVSPNRIRFEALDGSFSATITVDNEGLVVDYPGIARRI
ncbi:MAG: putative glycolipid-binding domain-containing protein [Acidimicrobiales bacterium]